jgi:hypothetical protein
MYIMSLRVVGRYLPQKMRLALENLNFSLFWGAIAQMLWGKL